MRGRREAFAELTQVALGSNDNSQISPELAEVGRIAWRAARIPFESGPWRTFLFQTDSDTPEVKVQKRMLAGQELLQRLTPDILNQPDFYSLVNGATHSKILQLLGSTTPSRNASEEEVGSFMATDRHEVLTAYLANLALYHPITPEFMRAYVPDKGDYLSQLSKFLFRNSDINPKYLEKVLPSIGIPVFDN